tara:strand:+ start:963 stop:1712 length:750 start_codon:yes stop_codon:yes gene_type:complete
MSKTTIPTGGITADAIDATLIADDAVSEEHLDATAITGHTALAEAPADTDEFLISDGGTLKRLDASYVGGGAMVLLANSSSTSTVADKTFDGIFSSTYDHYRIVGTMCPTDDDVHVQFILRASSSNVSGTIYDFTSLNGNTNSSDTEAQQYEGDQGLNHFKIAAAGVNQDPTSDAVAFDFILSDPNTNIIARCYATGTSSFRNGGSAKLYAELFAWGMSSNPDADGFNIYFSGGSIRSHSIQVYGLKKS